METVLAKKFALGEILLERRLITAPQLSAALTLQRKSGGRLGDILIAEGTIGYYDLYRTLADYYALPFVNLLTDKPDAELLTAADADDYLRLQVLPWQKKDGQLHIATCDLSDEGTAWVKQRFGEVGWVITSPFDIRRTVENNFGHDFEHTSRLSLWHKSPHASARVTLPLRQKQIFYGLLLVAIAIAAARPVQSALYFILFCHIAYGATMLFKCWVFARGTKRKRPRDWKKSLATLDERRLPVYTILVPMYREASSLSGMLQAMQRLDYPASKLDIKLVLEADDGETLAAAYKLKPRYQFDIIRVPPAEPRTKPRACNYALKFARGEFVTIFDADDRPERLQLKKAVYMFRNLPPDVACLQARLNYYNLNDNWLTRFFSLEYTILFHFMLPGLERIGIPIPLGGTSNHIALTRIRDLGEWDPFNVTEDADLGTRLAAHGWRTVMLDSHTLEEAPNAVMPWIRQRSRWIKGYMQTWLVHMRDPAGLWRTLGWKSFTGFQFFVGLSSFTFLTAPLVWGLSVLWMGKISALHNIDFPLWLAGLTLFNLFLNLVTHWYLALYSAFLYRRHVGAIATAALLYPLYLILHSIASYKALWQLIFNPHFWEKTTHGLAKYDAGDDEWMKAA